MANVDVTCGNCGATAPAPEDGTSVKCMFCGGAIQHIKSTTESTNQNPQVDNLLSLAESANESKNFEEAYGYFNRVIELDIENPTAWLGKGLAAVWQSTLANTRTSEMLPAFKNALKYSSGDGAIESSVKRIAEESGEAYLALCNLAANHYSEYGYKYNADLNKNFPDGDLAAETRNHISGFIDEYVELYDWVSEQENELEQRTGKVLHLDLAMDYYMVEMLDYVWMDINIANVDHPSSIWSEIWFKDHMESCPANKDTIEGMVHPWSGRKHFIIWDLYGLIAFSAVNRHEQRNYDEVPEEYKEKYEIHDPREHIAVSDKAPGSCFIATAVYGDENHPDLDILRGFRDNWLRNRSWGDSFISFYYQYGPMAAERVKAHPVLKACVKPLVLFGVAIAKKL
jgi:hypothetical protein